MATDHEDFVRGVDRQTRGGFARSERPSVFDLESLGVEFYERTFVFEVDEHFALAVGGAEFGASAERESADEFSGSGVDGRGSVGVAVEGEDALGKRIVNDGVGVFVRLDVTVGFERREIEDGDVRCMAVSGEALVKFVGESDAVNSLRIGNVADDCSLIGINDDDMSGTRDEETMCGRINFEIVPAAAAAQFYFFD